MSRSKWFTVDVDGLEALAARRSPAWWIYELVQNSWDEPGVSVVDVRLDPIRGRKDVIKVSVIDDAPGGWADLEEASTLFARSKKAVDANVRGRFNLGEKLFLSICESARITSTTGSVSFTRAGNRTVRDSPTVERGTAITAVVKVHPNLIPALTRRARSMIPQVGISTAINGERLFDREQIGLTIHGGPLATEVEVAGEFKRTKRMTDVSVYRLRAEETPTLFEMGIPVCEHDGDHHIDVNQVVPQSIEREGPTPAYLRDLYGMVLNVVADTDEFDADSAAKPWVATGMPKAEPEAVAAAVTARFGEGAVTHSPRAPESNAEAAAAGRTVIPPGSFDKAAWEAVRRSEVTEPASVAFPTGVEHKAGGSGPIDPGAWSPQMVKVNNYAFAMAQHLGIALNLVHFYDVENGYAGWFGDHTLSINLGGGMFGVVHDPVDRLAELDAFLIHELAHAKVSNHLSHAFHEECCRLGARLRTFGGRP